MTRRVRIVYVAAAAIFLVNVALACEIRVRDSAFRVARDVHRIYVIADPADSSADDAQQRLQRWLDAIDGDLNLEVQRIDASDPDVDWTSIGIPSAPPSIPVTVLVGRDNGNASRFVIDHWEPAPTDEELDALADSPIRKQLAGQLARNIAVLINAPRDLDGLDDRSEDLMSAVAAGMSEERIGFSIIDLDRRDPDEKLLCRFMGLRPESPDTLCVAFGRGKLMTPPLIGDEITAENITTLVTQIRQACSCSKPLSTMGVDIPLVWSNAIDSTVVLMDEELDLAELDTEVQNMLDAKASAAAVSETTEVSIPPGRVPQQPGVEPSKTRQRLLVLIGIGVLTAIVVLGVLNYLRLARVDSTL